MYCIPESNKKKRKEISSQSHKTLDKHDLTQKIRCQIRLMQIRDLTHFQHLLIISSEQGFKRCM